MVYYSFEMKNHTPRVAVAVLQLCIIPFGLTILANTKARQTSGFSVNTHQ